MIAIVELAWNCADLKCIIMLYIVTCANGIVSLEH
jgi:hypothetical protein